MRRHQLQYTLQVQNNGIAHKDFVTSDQVDSLVQDALDAIEFIMGGPETNWGSVRADMGHPEPWNITKFGVGNEASSASSICKLSMKVTFIQLP